MGGRPLTIDSATNPHLGPPPPVAGQFSTIEPEAPAVGTASVVTGRRIVAGLLDFLPMLAFMIAIGDRDGANAQLSGLSVLWWLLAGIVYYGIAELLTGTSPGKAVMGLYVRQLDTSEPTSKQILVRTGWRIIDVFGGYLLGLIVALTSPKRQRIGDRVAKTVVLQRAEVTKDRIPQRSAFILTMLVFATFLGSGILYAQSVEAEGRVGAFDIDAEVVPYTRQVIKDGFRPVSIDGIQAHLIPGLVDDAELDRTLVYMLDAAGELTHEFEVVNTEAAELQISPTLTTRVVNVHYVAEFEKGLGQLSIAVADIDGELKLVGFLFRLY